MCDCCCGDGRRYAHVLTASSSRATYVEAEEVISQRFLRSPPAVLECTHGEARGQRLWLDACGWEAQKWQLDGRLQSVPHDERHAVRSMLLMCVNGSFVLQPLNAQSARSPLAHRSADLLHCLWNLSTGGTYMNT